MYNSQLFAHNKTLQFSHFFHLLFTAWWRFRHECDTSMARGNHWQRHSSDNIRWWLGDRSSRFRAQLCEYMKTKFITHTQTRWDWIFIRKFLFEKKKQNFFFCWLASSFILFTRTFFDDVQRVFYQLFSCTSYRLESDEIFFLKKKLFPFSYI